MARRPRVNAGRPGLRLLPIVAAVLLVHGLLLEGLSLQQAESAALRKMATPMFTRLLQQTPAASPPPAAAPAPAPRPTRLAAQAITPSTGAATATAAVTPEQAPPPAAAEEPEALASETPETPPGNGAGAPVADATEEALSDLAASAERDDASAAAAPPSQAASAPEAPSLDSWPRDTRLTYQLGGQFRSGELYGDARVQWQREDNRYQAQIDIDITLMVSLVLTSQGEVTPHGLLPSAFEERKSGKVRSLRLGEETVTLANGRSVPRPQGVQDTASQFVELAHRFASGRERLEVGRAVSLWLARPGAVDRWTYDVVGRETLKTARLGEVEAFHLKPRPIAHPRGNITAEMWFAPSLQYLPVRIRVSMGDATYVDLLVDKIEQR